MRCGSDYAEPKAVEGCFGRLGRAFEGRYLDELTRNDVFQYRLDRLHNSGPFHGWPRKVGMRAPQLELTALSALYSYLIAEEEREILNPCVTPAGRGRRTKAMTYRPERKPIIADRAQRLALFRSTSRDPAMRAFSQAGVLHGRAARERGLPCAAWRRRDPGAREGALPRRCQGHRARHVPQDEDGRQPMRRRRR